MKDDIKEQCVRVRKDPIIVLEEKKCKLYIDNPNRKDVTVVQIDGCAIADNNDKCDKAYSCNGQDHFVELKGSNINHAIKQLEKSIEILGTPDKTKTYAEIVYVNSNIPNSEFAKKVKQFRSNKIELRKIKSASRVLI